MLLDYFDSHGLSQFGVFFLGGGGRRVGLGIMEQEQREQKIKGVGVPTSSLLYHRGSFFFVYNSHLAAPPLPHSIHQFYLHTVRYTMRVSYE